MCWNTRTFSAVAGKRFCFRTRTNVIFFFVTIFMIHVIPGGGAYCNGQKIHVSKTDKVRRQLLPVLHCLSIVEFFIIESLIRGQVWPCFVQFISVFYSFDFLHILELLENINNGMKILGTMASTNYSISQYSKMCRILLCNIMCFPLPTTFATVSEYSSQGLFICVCMWFVQYVAVGGFQLFMLLFLYNILIYLKISFNPLK